MKPNINIEAEGGELILKNEAGDHVIVPKKYRREVENMIKNGCHDCIDGLVETFPLMENYAEDGSLLPDWDKIKSKLNPMNWGVNDYTDKGDFGAAYSKAKKDGEEEFMWNGKRYSTDYAGTVEEETKSYFPEYNVITGVEPGEYINAVLLSLYETKVTKETKETKDPKYPKHTKDSKYPKYPHVFTTDLNKKESIDYPNGYNHEQFGAEAYDDTKYYASKIKTDSIYDKVSKMVGNNTYGFYDAKTRNCASAVCEGLELPYGNYSLPANIPFKLNLKYPTINLTSNKTNAQELEGLYNQPLTELINTNVNLLEKYGNIKPLIQGLQYELSNKGYELPKSTKKDGSFDGVWGEETKQALLHYQRSISNMKKSKEPVDKATGLGQFSKNQY